VRGAAVDQDAERVVRALPAPLLSQDLVGGAPTTGGRVTTSDRS